MTKIYTNASKQFRSIALLGLLAIATNVSAQNITVVTKSNNCGNVIADFNQGTQGYTSKSVYDDGSQSFYYNNRRGYWSEIGDNAHERTTASPTPRDVSILSTDYRPLQAGFFDVGFVYVVPNPAVDQFKIVIARITTKEIPGGLDQTTDEVIAESLNPATGLPFFSFNEFSSIAPTPYTDPFGNPFLTGQRGAICVRVSDAEIITGPNIRYRISISYRIASGGTFTVFDDLSLSNVVEEAPLPVNFITITAKKNDNNVDIKWAVADEINVDHYEIERSSDGRNFKTIGSVYAGKKNVYSYTDGQVPNGPALYRVKNVDIDGRFKYSTIIRVNFSKTIELRAFPSPATNQVTIEYPTLSATGKFTVATIDGRTVKMLNAVQGTNQTSIDLTGLKSGMYIVRFDNGSGKTESMKVMKQ
jgi:hypothetical protein